MPTTKPTNGRGSRREAQLRETIATNIRHHRQKRGISQMQLAELVNMNHRTISNVERGQDSPSTTLLLDLHRAFKLPVPALMRE